MPIFHILWPSKDIAKTMFMHQQIMVNPLILYVEMN